MHLSVQLRTLRVTGSGMASHWVFAGHMRCDLSFQPTRPDLAITSYNSLVPCVAYPVSVLLKTKQIISGKLNLVYLSVQRCAVPPVFTGAHESGISVFPGSYLHYYFGAAFRPLACMLPLVYRQLQVLHQWLALADYVCILWYPSRCP